MKSTIITISTIINCILLSFIFTIWPNIAFNYEDKTVLSFLKRGDYYRVVIFAQDERVEIKSVDFEEIDDCTIMLVRTPKRIKYDD